MDRTTSECVYPTNVGILMKSPPNVRLLQVFYWRGIPKPSMRDFLAL